MIRAFILMTGLGLLAACHSTESRQCAYHDDPIPEHVILTIQSEILDEPRTIPVYTPPGYEESDDAYPVLYMPDGGICEDFPHIVNRVDALVSAGELAPVIVVGIENTFRRRDLTPDSQDESEAQIAPIDDGATAFRAFIRGELMPQINSTYRTSGQTAIIGESAAGLFIVDTLFRDSQLFDRYIAMDPSIYWDNHELVRLTPERLPVLSGLGLTFWFTAAGTEDIYPHTDALAEILEQSAPDDMSWTYDPRPDEDHYTIYRATEEDALRWALWLATP